MRITGGNAGGRKLVGPRHAGVRPTSDKVREALFSILGRSIEGAAFLELFAGTGAVGMEAISRGASSAVLVESSHKSADLIRKNLDELDMRDAAPVVVMDALRFIQKLAPGMGPFDMVFMDPPYHTDAGPAALDALGAAAGTVGILSDGALVVFEHFKKLRPPESVGGLVKKKDYTYGDTVLSVYRKG